jgi:peroxiredoxin
MEDPKKSLAPDFSLKDIDGRMISLSDYRGNRNIVLVFNRGFF